MKKIKLSIAAVAVFIAIGTVAITQAETRFSNRYWVLSSSSFDNPTDRQIASHYVDAGASAPTSGPCASGIDIFCGVVAPQSANPLQPDLSTVNTYLGQSSVPKVENITFLENE